MEMNENKAFWEDFLEDIKSLWLPITFVGLIWLFALIAALSGGKEEED